MQNKEFKFKNIQTSLSQPEHLVPPFIHTIQPPVFRASTIIFNNTEQLFNRHWKDRYDYSYGTHGTPITYQLADKIAQIEGGSFSLLCPSGLSAINLVNSTFLKSGDEVWIADNMYGPNLEHLQFLAQQYNIIIKIYNPLDVESFQPSQKCKLLWLEAAGSLTLEFPDLTSLIKKAQSLNILTALDNTWGAGLAFCAFDLGNEHLSVDLTVHALTKYPSGGGDILMGSITTTQEALYHKVLLAHARQGISVSGDDCATVYRSLSSMALRYHQQNSTCQRVLDWLKNQKHFSQVLHPSLADSPGHKYWKETCSTGLSAGIVSVIFNEKYNWQMVRRFCDALNVFRLGYSWGGPTSLVMLYDLKHSRQLEQTHLQKGYLVRFCIGLEHYQDLINDIEQALDKIE